MPIFAEEIQNIRTMIRIYGMHTCPDCACIEGQVRDNDGYEIIDIGEHVRNLKAFLRLRDSSPVFNEARRNGSQEIEDGAKHLLEFKRLVTEKNKTYFRIAWRLFMDGSFR